MHSQRINGKVVRLCSSGLINAYSLCLACASMPAPSRHTLPREGAPASQPARWLPTRSFAGWLEKWGSTLVR